MSAVEANFCDLILTWQEADVPYDIAKDEFKLAIIAHHPNRHAIRRTYRGSQIGKSYDSESEFAKDWKERIGQLAMNVFYTFYEDPEIQKKKSIFEKNEDGVEVAPNGMSRQEYSKQRKHAESFPMITKAQIEQMRRDRLAAMEDDSDLFEEAFDGQDTTE
jgi:hypothetical protein